MTKTREKERMAINAEWSTRVVAEKKKNEEKIALVNEQLKLKQKEVEALKVFVIYKM